MEASQIFSCVNRWWAVPALLALATGCSPQLRSIASSLSTSPFIFHFGQTTKPTAAGGDDWVNALATDSDGNIYAAGATKTNLGGTAASGWDGFVMKISNAGKVEWITQMDSSLGLNSVAGDETPRGVVVLGSHVYITGYTTGSLAETNGGGSLADVFLSKFTLAGAHVWTKQLGSTTLGAAASGTDQAWGIATDGTSLYIGGQTSGNLGETKSGGTDMFVARYEPDGTRTWLRQIGATTVTASAEVNAATGNDYVESIAADSSGNVYLGGYSASAFKETSRGSHDAVVVKYTNAGAISWVRHLGATTLPAGRGTAADYVENIRVDGTTGDIYFGGSTLSNLTGTAGGGSDCYLGKLDASGALASLWQLSTNAAGTETDCRFTRDPEGNFLVTGYTTSSLFDTRAGAYDGFVLKLDPSYATVWSRQFGASETLIDSAGTIGDYFFAIATDAVGNVVLGGGTYGNFAEPANNYDVSADLVILRLNSTGDLY